MDEIRGGSLRDQADLKPTQEVRGDDALQALVDLIQQKFRTFGGGRDGGGWNPVADALKDQPLQFAAGVGVRDVAAVVLEEARRQTFLKVADECANSFKAGEWHEWATRACDAIEAYCREEAAALSKSRTGKGMK